jgi:hypothetical protein
MESSPRINCEASEGEQVIPTRDSSSWKGWDIAFSGQELNLGAENLFDQNSFDHDSRIVAFLASYRDEKTDGQWEPRTCAWVDDREMIPSVLDEDSHRLPYVSIITSP